MRGHKISAMSAVMTIVIAACGSGAVGPSISTSSPAPSPTSRGPSEPPCPDMEAGFPHQAPELEAVLPATVSGRQLLKWSLRGRCWLQMAISDPARRDAFVKEFTSATNPNPVDDSRLVYAIAGRSAPDHPPYFVFAALSAENEEEFQLVTSLMIAGAGATDAAWTGDAYQSKTLAGKEVAVGSEAMLRQDSHRRGRPYVYETHEYVFLLITDDDAWATDALRQLP